MVPAAPADVHGPGLNVGPGLKSVDQLSLSAHFSRFQGITEGYNLSVAGIPNDHYCIPGTK